jgi:hypothetical protein
MERVREGGFRGGNAPGGIMKACISFLSSKSTTAFANDYVVNSSSQMEVLSQLQKGCSVGKKCESDLERAKGCSI